jgi:hypothetical protein
MSFSDSKMSDTVNRSFKSIFALSQAVKTELECGGDLNQPLGWLQEYVYRIITEPLCTSHVLGSELLDKACVELGSQVFERVGLAFETKRSNTSSKDEQCIVYLVTKVQKSGGHTKLIQEFIRARPAARHYVLSTELDGSSDEDYFSELFQAQVCVSFEKIPGKSLLEKLEKVQTRLMQLRPEKTYLFNHHHDSVLASAIIPEMKLDAYFCHHGDHHLCLGVFHRHLKHIDFHPMGYNHCRSYFHIDNFYVPLAVPDRGRLNRSVSNTEGEEIITCTAGRSNKLEVSYFVQYVEIVPEILKATRGRHIHIGKLSWFAINKIRRGIRKEGLPDSAFIYIPWVASVWKTLVDHKVDLYIASFPYGGGLTLLEAMGAGVPVVLHKHLFSEILSGIDLAYEQAYAWRYPEELLNHLRMIRRDLLVEEGLLARAEYERYYDNKCLPKFLIECEKKLVVPRLSSGRFFKADDEWGFWMEQRLSVGKVLFRWLYRFFRNVRSRVYR